MYNNIELNVEPEPVRLRLFCDSGVTGGMIECLPEKRCMPLRAFHHAAYVAVLFERCRQFRLDRLLDDLTVTAPDHVIQAVLCRRCTVVR
jgi:hypothetical protein